MTATAAARQLLTEFQPLVGGYSFAAVAFGTIFGACDAPSSSKRPEGESAARERGGMSVAERLEASRSVVMESQPRELTFSRQLILTAPGIALALRLGRRAREIKAPPTGLALAAFPSLVCPLLLYLLVGYPCGVSLRALADGHLER